MVLRMILIKKRAKNTLHNLSRRTISILADYAQLDTLREEGENNLVLLGSILN